jgi:hypothetical protein
MGLDTKQSHHDTPVNDAAREPPEISNAVAASTKEKLFSLEEGPTAEVPSNASRAAPPQTTISSEPPPEVIEKAAEVARE